MIPELNRLAKHNEYLFMQNGARTPTVKLTLEMLKDRSPKLREPHHWSPNIISRFESSGFGDLRTLRILEQNV